jgi:hypothetical protein
MSRLLVRSSSISLDGYGAVLLGSGEHLLAGLDLPALGYRCAKEVAGEKGTHYVIARS